MRRIMSDSAKRLLGLILVALLALSTCAPMPSLQQANGSATSLLQDVAAPAMTQVGVQNTDLPDFVTVLAKVNPSVVAIRTQVVTYDIFNQPSTQEAAGSGWIYDDSGLVVTNNHVVQDAKKIAVTLNGSKTVPASLVGADSLSDLVVLRISAPNLTKIEIGNAANLQVGQWVLSVGNSLGLGITAKEGIVSRIGVSLDVSEGQTVDNLIETSALINPGNSGGPLVNMNGQIVGINSIKIATSGVEGMGYAINIGSAVPIIQQLVEKGYIIRPWLGVSANDIDPFIQLLYDLPTDSGALVVNVASGSPADKAGLKPGDVVVDFAGKQIKGGQDLIAAIQAAKIGDKVEITYWRGHSKTTIQTTLAETPAPK
jgi:serine protease Do